MGQGKDNTAYLVKHKQLGNFLALKTLSNEYSSPAQLHREIDLVKDFNHPGIPKIVDVIQEDKLYVLQEYIPGESLEEVLSNRISLQQFLSISRQLIHIIQYLHYQEKEPILYLDFKPEHIRIYQNQVYLVDYGQASKCINGKVNEVHYGTYEYSAPEVIESHYATVRSDIYSLGVIMEKMMKQVIAKSYWEKMKLRHLEKVVHRCTEENQELRFDNVNKILAEMKLAERRWQFNLLMKPVHLRETVAVIGTHHRVGTTHVAIGITHCYNQTGMDSIYVEQSAGQWLRQSSIDMETGNKSKRGASDLIRKGKFVGMPAYGPFYQADVPEEGIYVRDLGVLWEGFTPEAYDKVLVVLGSRYWEEEDTVAYVKQLKNKSNCLFVCSGTSSYRVRQLAQRMGVPVFSWDYDEDVFRISREKLRIMNQLLRKEIYA